MKLKVFIVVGARPNFMKVAPLIEEMKRYTFFDITLVHTGQHYSDNMSKLFFDDLELPLPDIHLNVGSGRHGEQTGKIMIEFERVLFERKPDLVVVVGDVNSTLACALTSIKVGVKVAHVEAGLRSFDREMPEEINRVLTDQISDLLFTTERSAEYNLLKEGIDKNKVYFVGNLMIDSLLTHLEKAKEVDILERLNIVDKIFAVLTLHRPKNVDSHNQFKELIGALETIQNQIPIIFPIHPRSLSRLKQFGLSTELDKMRNLIIVEPLGYLDFLQLISSSKFVLTDSGGIQEETTVLGKPCLTLRENTERPITVSHGTNILVGSNGSDIVDESMKILEGNIKKSQQPELWDGNTAPRIVQIFIDYFRLC